MASYVTLAEFSFNPTLVRLRPFCPASPAGPIPRFNPTLVRLRPPILTRLARAVLAVSIPRWFD